MNVSAKWSGGRAFTAVGPSGFNMTMDATPAYGGEGNGNTPTEMLLGALAGCIGIDITMILNPHLQDIKSIDIEVNGTRREELPTAFIDIEILFTIDGEITPKKVWRAIRLGKDKYCAVSASLKADVEFKLILNGEEVEEPEKRA